MRAGYNAAPVLNRMHRLWWFLRSKFWHAMQQWQSEQMPPHLYLVILVLGYMRAVRARLSMLAFG